jgi:uncharacterized protein (TIGR03435 family)
MDRPAARLHIMPRLLALPVCLLAGAGLVLSQAPSFEVASIRSSTSRPPSPGEEMHGMGEKIEANPGSLIMRNVKLSSCVRWAYSVEDYQVNGPGWIQGQRYDIAARSSGGEKEDQLRVMLQALLADRFKMEVHKETKVIPIYAMVVGKNGHKLHPAEGDGDEDLKPTGQMTGEAHNLTMARLCELLSMPFNQLLHTPVVDMTGLKGKWNFSVNLASYVTEDMQKHGPGGPSAMPDIVGIVQAALQEQLGLKLESRKQEMDLIVVDKAEKIPTEN